MARSLNEYKSQLTALLPGGRAWQLETTEDLDRLLTGIAESFYKLDVDATVLFKNLFASSVTEWIDEWESEWGLPNKCMLENPPETITERRELLLQQKIGINNQSRQTYTDLAEQLGYTISITEFRAGDTVPGHPNIPTDKAAVAIRFNIPLENSRQRVYGSVYGEFYSTFGNSTLECALKKISLAHHYLVFSYGLPSVTYRLTADYVDSGWVGYQGVTPNPGGSVNPYVSIKGVPLRGVKAVDGNGTFQIMFEETTEFASGVPDNFWTELQLTGVFYGESTRRTISIASADADLILNDLSGAPQTTAWLFWTVERPRFIPGNDYECIFYFTDN